MTRYDRHDSIGMIKWGIKMKAGSYWPQSRPIREWMQMLDASCAVEGRDLRHYDDRKLPGLEILEAAETDITTDFGRKLAEKIFASVKSAVEAHTATTDLGRMRAQSGRVTSMEMHLGQVSAWVQEPGEFSCRVDIWIDVIGMPAWKRLAELLSTRPDIASEILARRMPDNIEHLFESAGQHLFPTRDEIKVRCMCNEEGKLCMHAMAVFFVLAQECERNPFLMPVLRGCVISDLLETAGLAPAPEEAPEISGKPDEPASEPLPADPDAFWGRNTDAYDHEDAFIPATNAVVPKMLGELPLWRGSDDLAPMMEKIYREASQDGMRLFRGEPRDGI